MLIDLISIQGREVAIRKKSKETRYWLVKYLMLPGDECDLFVTGLGFSLLGFETQIEIVFVRCTFLGPVDIFVLLFEFIREYM